MTVRINVAIESSLRRFGIVRKVKRSQAVFMWEDVVGPAAAKVSSAVTCKDGILFVEVKNSVWAAELSLLKRDIVKRLNRLLGKGTIKDIRFRATGRSFHKPKGKHGKEKGEETWTPQRQALPGYEITRIRELALGIKDPAVQEVFVRFAITAEETRKLRDRVSRG
ncbi:MAG TPA: DUF721 domain-containing protein [Firmicutes bacterium]|jgi:hypothetical protein|nr:DUF721 domain-containing protein [Bacillota bacterium]